MSYLEELRTSLLCAVKYNVPVILCGDFNLPNIDWTTVSPSPCTPDASMFCEIISDSFLSQLVSFNTRKDHILDLVLTKHPDRVSFISPCDSLPDTDHNAISFSVSAVLSSSSNNTRFLYNYSDIDLTHFNSVFFRILWNVIDHDSDIELSWSMWKDLFLCAIDSTIPKVKWKSRKLKHWFSPSTINLIHKKSKLYKAMRKHPTAANKLKYRTISNLVRTMTRCETKKRAIDLSQSSLTIKKFWSWVNSVKRHRTSLPPLHSENTIITDDCAKADMFNKYFYCFY